MFSALQTILKRTKKAFWSFKIKIDFGYQDKIDVLLGQGSGCSYETGMSPHQFDKTDSVRKAHGFVVGPLDRLGGDVNSSFKTKRPGYHVYVIINGLWDSNNTCLKTSFLYCIRYPARGQKGSVTPDHEQDADIHPVQAVDYLLNGLGAP